MAIIGIKLPAKNPQAWRLPIARALALAILLMEGEEARCRQAGDRDTGPELRQALVTLRELQRRIAGASRDGC